MWVCKTAVIAGMISVAKSVPKNAGQEGESGQISEAQPAPNRKGPQRCTETFWKTAEQEEAGARCAACACSTGIYFVGVVDVVAAVGVGFFAAVVVLVVITVCAGMGLATAADGCLVVVLADVLIAALLTPGGVASTERLPTGVATACVGAVVTVLPFTIPVCWTGVATVDRPATLCAFAGLAVGLDVNEALLVPGDRLGKFRL